MVSQLTASAGQALKPRGTLAIVAGAGKLPVLLARSAKERGYRVASFPFSEDSIANLKPVSDAVHQIYLGALGATLKWVKKENVTDVVFVGKFPKVNLLRTLYKLDWEAVKFLSKLKNFNDESIQLAVGELLESHGVLVRAQSDFLQELFPEVGVLTKRIPTADEYADIEYGIGVARELARQDIGQTVVVRDRMVVALEGLEGTDETIKRGVVLAQKPIVVAKVARPKQDPRFDVPAVGMNTIKAMVAPKPGGVLALEAGGTMMVDRDEMIEFADANHISIVSCSLASIGK